MLILVTVIAFLHHQLLPITLPADCCPPPTIHAPPKGDTPQFVKHCSNLSNSELDPKYQAKYYIKKNPTALPNRSIFHVKWILEIYIWKWMLHNFMVSTRALCQLNSYSLIKDHGNNSFMFCCSFSNFTLTQYCSSFFMPHLALAIQFNDSVVLHFTKCQNMFHAVSVMC